MHQRPRRLPMLLFNFLQNQNILLMALSLPLFVYDQRFYSLQILAVKRLLALSVGRSVIRLCIVASKFSLQNEEKYFVKFTLKVFSYRCCVPVKL